MKINVALVFRNQNMIFRNWNDGFLTLLCVFFIINCDNPEVSFSESIMFRGRENAPQKRHLKIPASMIRLLLHDPCERELPLLE